MRASSQMGNAECGVRRSSQTTVGEIGQAAISEHGRKKSIGVRDKSFAVSLGIPREMRSAISPLHAKKPRDPRKGYRTPSSMSIVSWSRRSYWSPFEDRAILSKLWPSRRAAWPFEYDAAVGELGFFSDISASNALISGSWFHRAALSFKIK